MSHRDYSKFSKPFSNNSNNEFVKTAIINQEPVSIESEQTEDIVEVNTGLAQVVETVPVIGIVNGCEMLNVRSESNVDSDVLSIIPKGTEIEVDLQESTDDFYKVKLPVEFLNVNGYCMKKFITIK